ncbi:DUF2808 domain-containing protein [Anabaena sp. UHCC 0399]|uniref:DUF2808 domain-containing protein n=1 Tax=Anabaena sp. UHCC 0399 TaxID=3110238 RepID=UPI002B1FB04C|nr:DUF2808 domain-containing protein [Anabaena sp. UHCC 0399]MEA5568398.1 DUF2808 domain-containing protein [Anabaena sp. UHCC 0399]
MRNYDYHGVYLFDVTAFPSGEQTADEFIGIGRCSFYASTTTQFLYHQAHFTVFDTPFAILIIKDKSIILVLYFLVKVLALTPTLSLKRIYGFLN